MKRDSLNSGRKAILGSLFILGLSVLILLLNKNRSLINSSLDWDVAIETRDSRTLLARIREKAKENLKIIQYSHSARNIKAASENLLEKPRETNLDILKIKYIKFLDYDLDFFLKNFWNKKKETELKDNPPTPYDKYLGFYDIRVLGHKGILVLKFRNNRLLGAMRFPKWAKGAWERCRNLQINDNKIYFVRSVSSNEERRRTGAPHFFRQVYRGEFFEERKIVIKGKFNSNKESSIWEGWKR